MIDTDFNKWTLHDASIDTFSIDWNNKTCQLNLKVFLKTGEDAVPCKIIWRDLIEISIPSKNPWGKSVFINNQRKISEDEYLIEMQSGDEIKISAGQVELIESKRNL
jgi:hypothetical protein